MAGPLSSLEAAFGSAVQIRNFGRSERFVVEIEFSKLVEVAAWFRMEETQRMDFLEAFTVYESRGRLVLSYFVRSHPHGGRIVLRSTVLTPAATEFAEVPSMIGVWSHAEPFEAELAPLFGIRFTGARGTGGVRKTFGKFSGFPLRKAFEWRGGVDP